MTWYVAPLAGSVDRNIYAKIEWRSRKVAPLAGSVDRNAAATDAYTMTTTVAPLAGSVDRNCHAGHHIGHPLRRSPRGERG